MAFSWGSAPAGLPTELDIMEPNAEVVAVVVAPILPLLP